MERSLTCVRPPPPPRGSPVATSAGRFSGAPRPSLPAGVHPVLPFIGKQRPSALFVSSQRLPLAPSSLTAPRRHRLRPKMIHTVDDTSCIIVAAHCDPASGTPQRVSDPGAAAADGPGTDAAAADPAGAAVSYDKLAQSYERQELHDMALRVYADALDIRKAALGETHVDVAATYSNMARVCEAKGDNAAAATMLERSLGIHCALIGSENVQVGRVYHQMARAYECRRDYDTALRMYQKEMDVIIRAHGPLHPEVGRSWNDLAGVPDDDGGGGVLPQPERGGRGLRDALEGN